MTGGTKTILVVDDQQEERDFLTTVLGDHGYATVSAQDGKEAMERVAESLPDLVTLDITMPESSGVATYRSLKTDDRTKHIPVVIVTGVVHDFERFIKTRKQVPPPDGFLSKPVEPRDLLDTVAKLLA